MAGGRVHHTIRQFRLQQIRKALIAGTMPARRLNGDLPLPYSPTKSENVRWHRREMGDFAPTAIDFAQSMAKTRYDQEAIVVSVKDGQGTFRNNHAFDGRRVLYESQLPFGELPLALQQLEDIEETFESVAYLSNTLVKNFYHWLFLTLPMLRLYQAAGIELDHVYVGTPLEPWQLDTLDFVGLAPEQIVTRPCRAKTAHVAILTRHVPGIPPEQVEWVRSTFVPTEPEPGHRRLFVGRGSDATTRRMIDEELIAQRLEFEFGFEYVRTSGMTFEQERELFSQAESIVGPYGAALTNLLFSPIGTKVLELQAFDNDFSMNRCYLEMSAVLGNPHGFLRGEPTRRKKRGVSSDVLIDSDTIVRAVDNMLTHNNSSMVPGTFRP